HSSDDEIRALSMAFDTMLKNLANMVHNIEEHFDHTNASIAEIKSASNEAAKHATLISSSSDDISTGAESSAEAIQQTAEAVEDATGLAKDVQVTADRSKEKASEMLEIITSSRHAVNQLVTGIQTLANKEEESLIDVERLDDNARQVETIV